MSTFLKIAAGLGVYLVATHAINAYTAKAAFEAQKPKEPAK